MWCLLSRGSQLTLLKINCKKTEEKVPKLGGGWGGIRQISAEKQNK